MQKVLTAALMTVMALSATAGIFSTPVGPAKVNLDTIVQATNFEQVRGKTNSSAMSTNTTSVFKATTTRTCSRILSTPIFLPVRNSA